MTDLRENLGWIIGSVLAAIAAFLGWFFESGLLNTIIGIVVGAGIAYFVQTKTQERAWKREYTLDIIEKIYGPLFEEMDNFLQHMKKKTYEWLLTSRWLEVKSTYRYLMLDEDFKTNIEQLYGKVEDFNKTLVKIKQEIIDGIVKDEAKKFLRFQPKTFDLVVKGKRYNEWIHTKVEIPLTLLKRKQPIEMVSDLYPELKEPSFYLEITNPSGSPYTYSHPEWMKEFDKFWKTSSKRFEQDFNVKTLRKQEIELTKEMVKTRKELEKRIQQQWKK